MEAQEGKIYLEYGGKKEEIQNLKQFKEKISDSNALVCTSTAKDLPSEFYPFITIFARTSPHDKEVIVR